MEKDIKLQALSATARAYFDRGVYVQYDQLFLNRSGSVREERRQKGMPPEYGNRSNTLHLDCSSFVYSVYYQTFGIELEADQTAELLRYAASQDCARALDYYFEHRNNVSPLFWRAILRVRRR